MKSTLFRTQHKNYKPEQLEEMLKKYFKDYDGCQQSLYENMGKFNGDIEGIGSNFLPVLRFIHLLALIHGQMIAMKGKKSKSYMIAVLKMYTNNNTL